MIKIKTTIGVIMVVVVMVFVHTIEYNELDIVNHEPKENIAKQIKKACEIHLAQGVAL